MKITKNQLRKIIKEATFEPVLEDDLDQLTLLLKAFAELPEGAKNAVYDLSASLHYKIAGAALGEPEYDIGGYNFRDVAMAYDALMPILRGGVSQQDIRGLMQALNFGKKEFF